MNEIELHVGMRRRITFEFDKPSGQKGTTEPPEATSDDPVTVGVVMDGEGAFFARGLSVGKASVTLSADVDTGEGVQLVEKAYNFNVVDQLADHIRDTIGEEETDPDQQSATEAVELHTGTGAAI